MSTFHPLPRRALVTAQFPKHRTAQVLPHDPIGFPSTRVLIVIGDHFLLVRVVGPRCERLLVMVDCRTRKRESTIVVGTPLPGTLADSVVGVARSLRVHERPTVQRNTDYELVLWNSLCVVPVHGGCGVDRFSIDIRLVVCGRVPGTSIIIGLGEIREAGILLLQRAYHQVPECQILVHFTSQQFLIVLRAARCSDLISQ